MPHCGIRTGYRIVREEACIFGNYKEAKAQLSEVVRLCSSEGPQILTVRGKEEAVVIFKNDYEKLIGSKPDFIQFMNSSPLKGIELDLERDKSAERDLDL